MTDPIGTAQERELIARLRFYGEVYAYQAEAADALQSRIAEVGRLETALTDARNNILSLLGGFRDDMPDAAVKLFQAQAKWIEAALSLHRRPTDTGGS